MDGALLALTDRERGGPQTCSWGAMSLCRRRWLASRVSFRRSLSRPLGAADFLELAQSFHTLVLDRVPVIAASERNEAKRFIILIDALYDMRVKLIASAAGEPETLYSGEGVEAFEFARTASRLFEMRSFEYLALPHGRDSGAQSGDLGGIAET